MPGWKNDCKLECNGNLLFKLNREMHLNQQSILAGNKRFNVQHAAASLLVLLFIGAVIMIVADRLDRLAFAANEVVTAAHEVNERDDTRAMLANDIRSHAEQGAGQLSLLFVQKEKEKRVSIYGEMDAHSAAIDQAIARITPLLSGAEEKEELSRLLKLRETFRDNLQETVDALELGDEEKAETLLATATRDNLQELRGIVSQLVKGQLIAIAADTKLVQQRKSEAEATLSRSRLVVVGLGLGVAVIGLLLGMILIKAPARMY